MDLKNVSTNELKIYKDVLSDRLTKIDSYLNINGGSENVYGKREKIFNALCQIENEINNRITDLINSLNG